jgi:hypothetical protein
LHKAKYGVGVVQKVSTKETWEGSNGRLVQQRGSFADACWQASQGANPIGVTWWLIHRLRRKICIIPVKASVITQQKIRFVPRYSMLVKDYAKAAVRTLRKV